MSSEAENTIVHCYCGSNTTEPHMFTCTSCKKRFHGQCLKSERPSPLIGDIFFKFTCANCAVDGTEAFERVKLQWTTVLLLSLYNLQLQGGGKCGYFRWREHVCRFIDQNWSTFFGTDKKKSPTWHGTVAGCLSNGANRYFLSGYELLGETGWWTLKSSVLPTLEEVETTPSHIKPKPKRAFQCDSPIVEGSRKKNSNILEAALSLKEKKACIVDERPKKRKLKIKLPKPDSYQNCSENDEPRGIPKIIIKRERSLSPEPANQWMQDPREFALGMTVPNNMFDTDPMDSTDTFNSLLEDVFSEISCDKTSLKSSPVRNESEDENSNSAKTMTAAKKLQQHIDTSRKKKAVIKDESPVKENIISDPKFTMMSVYEEETLLEKLEGYPCAMKQRPEIRRLYRKLVVRKLKRAKSLPLFDIDAEVRSLRGMDPPEYFGREDVSKNSNTTSSKSTILDRFLLNPRTVKSKSQQYSSFITRLMGIEDEQQDSIISPYTERTLKPFIFRDYSSKPLKLKLLEEIIAHANKSNPDFVPFKKNSIDYCYVRPQHIPAVNALCQEYFWPGIDLSETLQYPDFSCVAQYRKIIIGFAFMVPDVKYNEAYITFIFVHPEWRRAGIASFMLYHLIQTCMGKDVTLHVSATSSAVYLYKKMGFKVEEFIRNYYDKYLPAESKECRHALFLRLTR